MSIEVQNVFKIFGKNPHRGMDLLAEGKSKDDILKDHKLTVGVADVSFQINHGEIFVVMGLSGSGKSTLLRCLNRIHEPTSGKIIIDGEDVTAMDTQEMRNLRRERIGMVFQGFALFPNKTILDNVAFGLEIKGVPKNERREQARTMVEIVGLKGWEDSLPTSLSGGMQQRVGLARALASDPDILLMDEPFSALDPLIRKEMQAELLNLQAKMNKTIVFITHDLDEALSLGDRVAIMKDGCVIQLGTPEEILNKPEDEYVSKFTEDVDRSKILTAENVMEKSTAVAIQGRDGINTTLHKIENHKLSNILMVDRNKKLLGGLRPQDLISAKKSQESLEDILITDIPTVHKEQPIREFIDAASESDFPLAVVNDDHQLLGIMVRGSLIAALARRGDL